LIYHQNTTTKHTKSLNNMCLDQYTCSSLLIIWNAPKIFLNKNWT